MSNRTLWSSQKENIVACFELKTHGPEIVYLGPSTYYSRKTYAASEEYLFPPLIVWDPFVQQPDVFNNGFCCLQESHTGEAEAQLKPKKWKDGRSERDTGNMLATRRMKSSGSSVWSPFLSLLLLKHGYCKDAWEINLFLRSYWFVF